MAHQLKIVASAYNDPSARSTKGATEDGCEFEATLLAIAGHDLRQPLQVIQHVNDLLGNGLRTDAELKLLHLGQTAIERLTGQLDQLLSALRFSERESHVKLSPVELGPLLREIGRENLQSALQKGLQMRLVPTAARVMSDTFLLGAVLRNLVGNAIKYTEPGGRVLLGCRHFRNSVRIDVFDTGIGIADEQMSRIFDAFTRVDSTREDGLGIGLFIVRHAIAILRHRVDVSSVASRGTRFSILAKRAYAPADVCRSPATVD